MISRGKKSCSGSASKSSRTGRSAGLRVFEQLDDPGVRAGADDAVDLRDQRLQFGAEALREAAGHDQLLTGPLALGVLEDHVGRFGLRRIDEGARVDHDRIGVGGIGNQLPAGGTELADHHLGVDEVLRAAERYESRLAELRV